MQVQLKEWGNSVGIRLVKEILQEADFTKDDILDVSATRGRIVISKPFRHRTLEERAEKYGGTLNLDGEYDWGEPVYIKTQGRFYCLTEKEISATG